MPLTMNEITQHYKLVRFFDNPSRFDSLQSSFMSDRSLTAAEQMVVAV